MARTITFCLPGILIETRRSIGTPARQAALLDDAVWRRRVSESLASELGLGPYELDRFEFEADGEVILHERIPYPIDLFVEQIGPPERAFAERLVELATLIEAASVDEEVVAILHEGLAKN